MHTLNPALTLTSVSLIQLVMRVAKKAWKRDIIHLSITGTLIRLCNWHHDLFILIQQEFIIIGFSFQYVSGFFFVLFFLCDPKWNIFWPKRIIWHFRCNTNKQLHVIWYDKKEIVFLLPIIFYRWWENRFEKSSGAETTSTEGIHGSF